MRGWFRHLITCTKVLICRPVGRFFSNHGGEVFIALVVGILSGVITFIFIDVFQDRGNRGICEAGMVISSGQYCSLLTEPAPFRIIDGIAVTPWRVSDYDADPRRDQIKVDLGTVATHTFQAARRDEDSWEIVVIGPWLSRGQCRDGIVLNPGEQCTYGPTGSPFRIYVTDELNNSDRVLRQACRSDNIDPDDCRQFHSRGYGMFYHFADEKTPIVMRQPNAANGRLDDDLVLIYPMEHSGDRKACNTEIFKAVRQSRPASHTSTDQWRIESLDLNDPQDHNLLRSSVRSEYVYTCIIEGEMARILFGGKPVYYGFERYGELQSGSQSGSNGSCNGYDGGHSGWHAQTRSVAKKKTDNEPFFSLSAGFVISTDASFVSFGHIAVYNAVADITTLYLHAREINVDVGQWVNVGTRLGIQGNTGLSDDPTENEHVHIEVRDGRKLQPACGANASLSPYSYLYGQITATERHSR